MSFHFLDRNAQLRFRKRLFQGSMKVHANVPNDQNAIKINGATTWNKSWHGGWNLAEGYNAVVGLWLQQDADGKVVNRIAIKDVALPFPEWNTASLWDGGIIGGRLEEAVIQERLALRQPAMSLSRIARSFGDEIIRAVDTNRAPGADEVFACRVFMEYGSRGSLDQLVERHEDGGDPDHNTRPGQKRPIPEPFLWYLFEQLALMCEELEGHQRPSNAPAPTTMDATAVHADLKLQNILLVKPHATYFPEYPQIKLCDFGLTRMTWPNEPNNPASFAGHCPTLGWVPYELFQDLNGFLTPPGPPLSAAPFPITGAANIWASAMMIRACMLLERDPEMIEYDITRPPQWTPSMKTPRIERYSHDLRNLVASCLGWNPNTRPTATALLAQVRNTMGPHIDGMNTFKLPRYLSSQVERNKEKRNRACAEKDGLYPLGSYVFKQPMGAVPIYQLRKTTQ